MKKIIIILSVAFVGSATLLYYDILNKPVETIDELIGHNYDYAHKMYFQTDPDSWYEFNINGNLNEFDGKILSKKSTLADSIIYVFTWNYATHKKTIWVGRTEKMESQIIEAIRYSNNTPF